MNQSRKVNELLNDVEELLAHLGDKHSSDVVELRNRVKTALDSTKRTWTARASDASDNVRWWASSLDSYIVSYPRLAFASGILVAGTLGFLAGTMRTNNDS